MNFFKTFLAALLAIITINMFNAFMWMIMMVVMFGSMGDVVNVKPNSILKIDLSENIVDAPVVDPLGDFTTALSGGVDNISLMSVIASIEVAKDDENIQGIYIRPSSYLSSLPIASLEEVRAALEDFKTSGKFIVAYADFYRQGDYYLASVADKVYLQPQGSISWQGVNVTSMFFKGLLDKIGASVDVFRPSNTEYKSAVEPFIRENMSKENREQLQSVVDSFWESISTSVMESRGIDKITFNNLTDELKLNMADDALKYGMVDSLIYEDEIFSVFENLGATKNSKDSYNYVTLSDYATTVSTKNDSDDNQVAVIYAEGTIIGGEGVSAGTIYGNSLAAGLKKLRKDEDVKAVVLRVNSPGGSAQASDVVWREMELLRAEKPVVVSMGSYAASGGYYISAPADMIIANKTTLTGSIGVYSMLPNVGETMKRELGLTFDGVSSNTSAGFGSSVMGLGLVKPLSPIEKELMSRGVDEVYETFTGIVSKGRNLPMEAVLAVSQGRVWSGEEALNIGLVDGIGGLKHAVSIAASRAELGDEYSVVQVVDAPAGFDALLSSLSVKVSGEATKADPMAELLPIIRQTQELLSQKGVVAVCPYVVNF